MPAGRADNRPPGRGSARNRPRTYYPRSAPRRSQPSRAKSDSQKGSLRRSVATIISPPQRPCVRGVSRGSSQFSTALPTPARGAAPATSAPCSAGVGAGNAGPQFPLTSPGGSEVTPLIRNGTPSAATKRTRLAAVPPTIALPNSTNVGWKIPAASDAHTSASFVVEGAPAAPRTVKWLSYALPRGRLLC